MVLQRDQNVRIWGWAENGAPVSVRFMDSTFHCKADGAGQWEISLPASAAGGPYEMQIFSGDTITIRDIVYGDVWICSGQSNMELPMSRVSWVYGNEIANSENEFIRHFYVPRKYDFSGPQEDLSAGRWEKANPGNVPGFSAVAYFFAKELYDEYKVPVGIINTALGGSPAEAWMSGEAIKEFPMHYEVAQRFRDSSLRDSIIHGDRARIHAWYKLLRQRDEGYRDPRNLWYDQDLNTSEWDRMDVPGYWSDTPLGAVNGVVWFRKQVSIPCSMAGKPAKLVMGRIVDADSVFVNAELVGSTSYQYPPRRYDIPSGLLSEGENSIVVRVISNMGRGGFVYDKPYRIFTGTDTLDLEGEWHYRLGAEMEPLAGEAFIRWKPTGLYNAMIAPLHHYRIRGVLWYQGEANAHDPVKYRELMQALIGDWRAHWMQGDFPFIFAQLHNFMKPADQPGESNWALARESQLRTLSVPNTGMAVTIDLGEWNDIHPLNKKDVGSRLALAARKVAYEEEGIVSSGPVYQSKKIDGDKIIMSFTDTGSGLIARGGGELKHFALAGADRKFVWASAYIKGDKVVVHSDKVPNPVAVRYAWADNPEGANLYNREGLPASPFRTDDWISTENQGR